MKKYAAGLVVLSLATAACGSSSNGGTGTTNAAISQATSKVDTVLKRCLPMKNGIPDPLALTSSTARTAFVNCAVPPAQRAAFKQCVVNVALGGLPTKSRLESGINGCLSKAGV